MGCDKCDENFKRIGKECGAGNAIGKVIKNLNEYSKSVIKIKGMDNLLTYHLRMKSRRIRLLKMLLAARLTGGVTEDCRRIICALEMSNSAIFLHDDIIDHDFVRKGKPTLNAIVGYEKALLIGNALHALAFRELSEIKNRMRGKILSEFGSALSIEHIGQYMDIDLRWNFKGNLRTWETMILRHSAFYVIAALKSIAMSNNSGEKTMEALAEYEKNCTLAGAAEDAICGFNGRKQKGDLKNGAFTIIVNFALEESGKIPKSNMELERMILSSRAVERTQEYIREKVENAVRALECMRECKEKDSLIFLARQVSEGMK